MNDYVVLWGTPQNNCSNRAAKWQVFRHAPDGELKETMDFATEAEAQAAYDRLCVELGCADLIP